LLWVHYFDPHAPYVPPDAFLATINILGPDGTWTIDSDLRVAFDYEANGTSMPAGEVLLAGATNQDFPMQVELPFPSDAAPAPARVRLGWLNSSRGLGILFLMPALVLVVLFFLMPVVLTGVFAFTNMSTATGITGGAYQISPGALRVLTDRYGMGDLAERLGQPTYVVDEQGLAALERMGLSSGIVEGVRAHQGEVWTSRREFERVIRDLRDRPDTRTVKRISDTFSRSLANARFRSADALIAAADAIDPDLTEEEKEALLATTYTGWTWTTNNFQRLAASRDTTRVFFNTLFFVAMTLVLFNTGYAMLLAIATHYIPERPAGIFRIIWFLPRISPVVIYVLLSLLVLLLLLMLRFRFILSTFPFICRS
jgi:inositol-phosphate transport system permease protein